MFSQLLYNIVFFIAIMFAFHIFYQWINDKYKTKKPNDLVNTHFEKYKRIFAEIEEKVKPCSPPHDSNIPKMQPIDTMDAELTQYMESLV